MKISGRIKALILMAVAVYVLAHVVRVMSMMLVRPTARLPSPRRVLRLGHDKAPKHCTRC